LEAKKQAKKTPRAFGILPPSHDIRRSKMTVSAPRWDLTNVYPSLESKEFKTAIKKYKSLLDEMEVFFKKASKANSKTDPKKLGKLLGESVDRFNALFTLSGTIHLLIPMSPPTHAIKRPYAPSQNLRKCLFKRISSTQNSRLGSVNLEKPQ
jgi:hypothetical protein